MIKAKLINPYGRAVVVLGLSRDNVDRLLDNMPIHIKADQLQIGHDIVILGGETEDDITEDMRSLGMIS